MSNGLNVSSFLSDVSPALRQFLQCPEFELRLSEEWGADNKEARALLRQALSDLTKEDHSDLSSPPRSDSFSISISHCAELGGFACVRRPRAIGFDVEIAERVKDTVASRISTPEEKASAPSPALLWAAKEAVYKSLLGPGQPPHFTAVNIEGWLKFGQSSKFEKLNKAWEFRAVMSQTDPIPGVGIALLYSKFAFAFFYRSDLST